MSKKYIPDKAWLMCDKGQLTTQVSVTHDNNSKIYGEHLVSEADMVPGENVQPFGMCGITGGTCSYNPIYWDKCNQGVKVNGYKLVFEDANLLCKQGGKITVNFNVPVGSQFNFGFTGLGMASQWMNYNDVLDYNQRGTIYDVENGRLSLNVPNNPNEHRRRGNYGEMKDNVYHREQGWRDIRNESPNMNIDKPTASGIDGIYEQNGTYRITDSKYGTARIANTSNGRELSRRWTESHLDNGAVPNNADEAAIRQANTSGTLQREVIYTDKTEGGVTRSGLSSETQNITGNKATRGQFETLNMQPASRASQFVDGMRSGMRNSSPVQALANSRFSNAVRSSTAATKANNGLWRATQFIEASPALRTTGKVVGRGAIVVGIALDALSIASAYQEEGGFGDKTQQATGSAVGGAAGAWAGAEIGAVIGTAICPGVGTVIGGLVGGIAGGLIGSGVGSKVVDWLF
jgi:hypothetical protein